jgi:hypothetical protein
LASFLSSPWAALLSRLLGSNPAIVSIHHIVGVDSLQIASRAAFRVRSWWFDIGKIRGPQFRSPLRVVDRVSI